MARVAFRVVILLLPFILAGGAAAADHHFECLTTTTYPVEAPGSMPPSADLRLNDRVTLRTIITCTGEFTAYHGSVGDARAAALETFERLSALFLREMSVEFEIVTTHVYADAATDPFPAGGQVSYDLVALHQDLIDALDGPEAYDLAVVLTQGGNTGVGNGSVCEDGTKARCAVSRTWPDGDRGIDLVAHEVGHMVGTNHTYNADLWTCGNGRTWYTAYEPGSGSTIMSYAGLCNSENVTLVRDEYFHVESLRQMRMLLHEHGGCGQRTPLENAAPVITLTYHATVPRGTPFYLVGRAQDPDGDPLTYCWEQYDLGEASPPVDPYGPLFRSLPPDTVGRRFLPRLETVLAGEADRWEPLPWVDRTLTFQFTVRDNRPDGGQAAWYDLVVDVAGAPFRLVEPDGGEVFQAGQPVDVSWEVGGGSVAPEVDIRLVHGGGSVDLGTVTNDGFATVVMPPGLSVTDARIWIEGHADQTTGARFYAVSAGDLTLVDVPVGVADRPDAFVLHEPAPNPANPATVLRFSLPSGRRVSLDVYDLRGRRVRGLVDGDLAGGSHAVRWDGRDGRGRAVASGVYVVRLEAGGHATTDRVVVVR